MELLSGVGYFVAAQWTSCWALQSCFSWVSCHIFFSKNLNFSALFLCLFILSCNIPLSIYVPIVQALKNGVTRIINLRSNKTTHLFHAIFDNGAAQSVADQLGPCFNMDGFNPPDKKVELMNEYHWWDFSIYPFANEWMNKFIIHVLKRKVAKEMISFYIDDKKEQRAMLKDVEVSIVPHYPWRRLQFDPRH